MKIVIISAFFYPSLSPRAQRTTELAKEFARQGNDVIVYSLLGDYDYSEFSLVTKVVVKNLGSKPIGYPNSDGIIKNTLCSRAINKLFGRHLWLPDRRMVPWVKTAIKREGQIDFLLTIAVPHVIHYASSVSNLSKVDLWVADCGDPFTLNPYTKGLLPKYLVRYEKHFCRKCDYITVPVVESINGYYPEFRDKIRIIPQGYNFEEIITNEYIDHDVPTFAYAGAVYKGLRDPQKFIDYLVSLNSPFHLTIFGPAWDAFKPYVSKVNGVIENGGFVPRIELIPKLSQMDFLINIRNNSGVQQPSKLIDYALSGRPILTISSDFPFAEKHAFEQFCHRDYTNKTSIPNIFDYDIKNVAKQFLELKRNEQ